MSDLQKEDFWTKSVNLSISSNNSNESKEIQGNTLQEPNDEEPEKFNWKTVLRSLSEMKELKWSFWRSSLLA